jgi:L-ascorbate 6-phosphate lactonase
MWFLGQAGYYLKSGNVSIVIDPYLSDSAASIDPALTRMHPIPVRPSELYSDIFIVTHSHSDHLDPETIIQYRYKDKTKFAAPRFAAKKLVELGVPKENVCVVGVGENTELSGVYIEGIFALPTGADVLDTTGYLISFPNGKSIYHTSDTGFCGLLLQAAPKVDALLTCINGKWGNLNVGEAIKLVYAVKPKYAIPNHYDMMAPNMEDPTKFTDICENGVILKIMEEFIF